MSADIRTPLGTKGAMHVFAEARTRTVETARWYPKPAQAGWCAMQRASARFAYQGANSFAAGCKAMHHARDKERTTKGWCFVLRLSPFVFRPSSFVTCTRPFFLPADISPSLPRPAAA